MTINKSMKRKKPNRQASRPNKMAKFEFAKKPRHQFVSFPSAASQLSLNTVSSAATELWADPDSPTTSIFNSRIQHWADLNLTQAYTEFSRTVSQYSTLPLVLHNKDLIFASLKEHIGNKDEYALESLFDLCAAFAFDLQREFAPYYDDLVLLVADCAKLKNAAVLKACFDALNQIIKVLLRSTSSAPGSTETSTKLVNLFTRTCLLQKTLTLFKLGIPTVTHRLCAGAVAQILRKSGSDLAECINVLLLNAADGGGLVQLAGMILIQSLKMTSKSVTANASKILETSLEAIDNLDWPEDDVTEMISAMLGNLDGLESSDVASISTSVLRFWIKSPEVKKINSKIRSLNQLLRLGWSKTTNEAEVLAGKLLKNCLHVEELCEDSLIEAANGLCSGNSREEAWSLIEAIIRGGASKDRKSKLLTSLTNLDIFEAALLHRIVQNLDGHKDKEEALFLAIEGLWTFAQSKLRLASTDDTIPFTIEFPYANPKDLNTLPNRILQQLETVSWDDDQSTKLLSMLSVVRPLHQDVAIDLFKKAIKSLAWNGEKVGTLGLAVRALGELSCPHDFLQVIKDFDILATLRSKIDHFEAAQTLSFVVGCAAASNAHDWIDVEAKRCISSDVIGKFHLVTADTRLCLVRCLVHLNNRVEHFSSMLSAEAIKPNIQTYRERLKYLSDLSCPSEIQDDFTAEANLRLLLSNLSVNFSLLWDPVIKIIDTYFSTAAEKSWNIFYSIFHDINSKAVESDEQESDAKFNVNFGVDFKNFRNLLLKSLDSLVTVVERKNALLAVEFLDVFMKGKIETRDPKGLSAFLGVYKQLKSLRSVARFDDIRGLAERCLGDHFLKTRETSVEFFSVAYKELRQHKAVMMDLVDTKKWKSVFLTFPTEHLESSEKFCELLCLIMVGKVRQTTKEKRKEQLNSRKGIVRSMFQLGKRHGLEFLCLLRKQQLPFLNDIEVSWNPQEISRKLDMVFDIYLLAANSAITCVDGVVGGAKEIFNDLISILKFQGRMIVEKNKLKKRRPKVLEQLVATFKALKANDWSEEDEQGLLNEVVWPLLQPELNEDEKSTEKLPQQRTCYLSKIVTLFNLWISIEKYSHWFFLKNGKEETILHWVQTVFESQSVAEDFRRKLFTSICKLIVANFDGKKERLSDEFVTSVLHQFQNWFGQKGKAKGGVYSDIPVRLQALSIVAVMCRDVQIEEKVFFDSVIGYAARGMGEVQTNAIEALHSLINRRRGEVPHSAYKLLTAVVNNEDNKLAVRKMLWKNTENLGIPLNDKLVNGFAYKTILASPEGVTNRQFLFLFHYGASEIYTSDYTIRSAAGSCLRELIYVMKKQMSEKDFLHLVDSAILPVLSKGLQSKTERVQSEFIDVLLETVLDDGRLGNNVNIASLRNNTDDPELNFFDNMKHIQKHRRGRALTRLAAKLDEFNDGDIETFLSRKTCFVVVYPLACSYLFNTEFTKFSDTIQAAITCIGSLCGKFNWKEYKLILTHFLNMKPTEAPHQKQRVKILAAILNSFHFVAAKKSSVGESAAKIVNTLLTKIRLQREDDQVDVALYVPILKILMLYPDKLKYNISTILVQTSRKLRSKFIEDRRLSRDILSEIATLLGPNYFPYILSILEGSLQRGYQLHILVHTINTVMMAMEPQACLGCFDSSLSKILEFVGKELFGDLTEEKKVAAIIKKTPEAAKTVAFSLLELLSSHMSKNLVCDTISGLLKTAVAAKSAFEALQKLRKAIKSVQAGLARNKDLERPTDYLQLSYGILSEQLLPAGVMKSHTATLKEFAFSLLLSGTSDVVVTGSQARQFWPFLRDGLENKDVNVVIACLKFLSNITQTKEVCDVLIDSDERDFVGVISSKCKVYHGMKNRQPYMCVAIVLRNLLTNGDKFEADHLKAICLFFEGCLDTNKDDSNAMRLLGLILFRFYSADAYAPFLKLLCTSCVQCRSESSFNVAKSILLKISKKHASSFNPVINFFIANINYEEETGRFRSITMCNQLLDTCLSKAQTFETQGLFVECATRLFNEYSGDCKKLLENLLTTIIKIQHKRKMKDGNFKNLVEDLILKWCCSPKPMHIGIGSKLMSLSLVAIPGTENVKTTRKSLTKIIPKLGEILRGQGDDGSAVYSFALAHVVELLNVIIASLTFRDVIFVATSIEAEKVAGLVLHQNIVVRRSVIKFFSSVISVGIDDSSERHKVTFADTKVFKWLTTNVLRTLVSNICELAKSDPFPELSSCLSSLVQLTEKGSIEDLTAKFVFKKARAIFTHEKFNLNQEWSRRKLFYDWARDVCEKTSLVPLKELIQKNLVHDMRQEPLADIVNEVQKIIEESFRK